MNLGEIFEEEGEHIEAYSHYRDSLKFWGELKHMAAIARCAEVIAGLEVRVKGRPSEAAFLFGAAEAIREIIDVPVEPFNMEWRRKDKEQGREGVDQEDFMVAWNAGRGLEADGVLRHVLGEN